MSLIPSGYGDQGLSELPTLLRRWMTIQEEMSALNTDLKQRRTQSKALKQVILRIMDSNGVAALNVNKGTIIHKIKETPEKISNQYLLKHCSDFFGGDEERAAQLVKYLEEHRSLSKTHDLRLQFQRDDASSRS